MMVIVACEPLFGGSLLLQMQVAEDWECPAAGTARPIHLLATMRVHPSSYRTALPLRPLGRLHDRRVLRSLPAERGQ